MSENVTARGRQDIAKILVPMFHNQTLIPAAGLCLAAICLVSGCTAFKDQVESPRDNLRLAQSVAEQIFADGLSDHADIQIRAKAGAVTLYGMTPTDRQAARVGAAARRVAGVHWVENRLRVQELTIDGQKHRRTLIEDVRQKLERALPRRGPKLLVDCDDGVIYLSGVVLDESSHQTALRAAQSTPGVRRVADNLICDDSRG